MDFDAAARVAPADFSRTCPQCGETFDLSARGPGRRPIWCSPRCRRLASAHRVAARESGTAVRVIEVPRAHGPDFDTRHPLPSMAALERLFLDSDSQCQALFEALERRYSEGVIGPSLRPAVERFAASIRLEQALSKDARLVQARDEIGRLRDQLVAESNRANEREREIDILRRENAEIGPLRARVAELEKHDRRADPPRVEPVRDASSLSRQQRRAAEREARKK